MSKEDYEDLKNVNYNYCSEDRESENSDFSWIESIKVDGYTYHKDSFTINDFKK